MKRFLLLVSIIVAMGFAVLFVADYMMLRKYWSLIAPVAFQTIQRDWNSNRGNINVVVEAIGFGDVIGFEYRWHTREWREIRLTRTGECQPEQVNSAVVAAYRTGDCYLYETVITDLLPGQFTLQLRLDDFWTKLARPNDFVSVDYVGVGDVFVISGQSNSVGYAQHQQAYYSPIFKAALYTREGRWVELSDNADMVAGIVPGFNSVSLPRFGSPWPLVATRIMAFTNAPVAFIPTGVGGVDISSWYDDQSLYQYLVDHTSQSQARPRYLLWHQGENDAIFGRSEEAYRVDLLDLATRLAEDLDVKMIVAVLGPNGYATEENTEAIRSATLQADMQSEAITLGPDFSDVVLTIDPVHFISQEEVDLQAERWFEALINVGLPPSDQ